MVPDTFLDGDKDLGSPTGIPVLGSNRQGVIGLVQSSIPIPSSMLNIVFLDLQYTLQRLLRYHHVHFLVLWT
jgi:hypothetical protein